MVLKTRRTFGLVVTIDCGTTEPTKQPVLIGQRGDFDVTFAQDGHGVPHEQEVGTSFPGGRVTHPQTRATFVHRPYRVQDWDQF